MFNFTKKVEALKIDIKEDYRMHLRQMIRSGRDITKDELEDLMIGLGQFVNEFIKVEENLWDIECKTIEVERLKKSLVVKNKLVEKNTPPLSKLRKEMAEAEQTHRQLVLDAKNDENTITRLESRGGIVADETKRLEELLDFVKTGSWISPNAYGV